MFKSTIKFDRTCNKCKNKWVCNDYEPYPDNEALKINYILATLSQNFKEDDKNEK